MRNLARHRPRRQTRLEIKLEQSDVAVSQSDPLILVKDNIIFVARFVRLSHCFRIYSSATCQLGSGSYCVIEVAIFVVSLPRSFPYTTPSGPTINVFTPDERYSAG